MKESDKDFCDNVSYFIHVVQTLGDISRRRRPDAHALATVGDRSGNLPVPFGIQRHILPGSQHWLLQVVQEHHCYIHHRD